MQATAINSSLSLESTIRVVIMLQRYTRGRLVRTRIRNQLEVLQ